MFKYPTFCESCLMFVTSFVLEHKIVEYLNLVFLACTNISFRSIFICTARVLSHIQRMLNLLQFFYVIVTCNTLDILAILIHTHFTFIHTNTHIQHIHIHHIYNTYTKFTCTIHRELFFTSLLRYFQWFIIFMPIQDGYQTQIANPFSPIYLSFIPAIAICSSPSLVNCVCIFSVIPKKENPPNLNFKSLSFTSCVLSQKKNFSLDPSNSDTCPAKQTQKLVHN